MTRPRMQPVFRYVPTAEIKIFSIPEYELDLLARGSPASLFLNFALFFLGVAASAFGTLWSAPPSNDRVYYTFLTFTLVSTIAGVVLLSLWLVIHQSTKGLVAEIKSRKPFGPAVRDDPGFLPDGES